MSKRKRSLIERTLEQIEKDQEKFSDAIKRVEDAAKRNIPPRELFEANPLDIRLTNYLDEQRITNGIKPLHETIKEAVEEVLAKPDESANLRVTKTKRTNQLDIAIVAAWNNLVVELKRKPEPNEVWHYLVNRDTARIVDKRMVVITSTCATENGAVLR